MLFVIGCALVRIRTPRATRQATLTLLLAEITRQADNLERIVTS